MTTRSTSQRAVTASVIRRGLRRAHGQRSSPSGSRTFHRHVPDCGPWRQLADLRDPGRPVRCDSHWLGGVSNRERVRDCRNTFSLGRMSVALNEEAARCRTHESTWIRRCSRPAFSRDARTSWQRTERAARNAAESSAT